MRPSETPEPLTSDFSYLAAGADDAEDQLNEVLAASQELTAVHEGAIASGDPERVKALLVDLEALLDRRSRVSTYVTARGMAYGEEHGAERCSAIVTEVDEQLQFISRELNALPQHVAEALVTDATLSVAEQHFLRRLQAASPYRLSDAEETKLGRARSAGLDVLQRDYNAALGRLRIDYEGAVRGFDEVFSALDGPSQARRAAAAAAMTQGLQPELELRAGLVDAIIRAELEIDSARGYPSWMTPRFLADETDSDTVDALMAAVEQRSDLQQASMAMKARYLGLPRLYDYDRYAPLQPQAAIRHWEGHEAVDIVLAAFDAFHPSLADAARVIVDVGGIDLAPRASKRNGAECHRGSTGTAPALVMTFSGTDYHVQVLAHELGHGAHYALARAQGGLAHEPSAVLAEAVALFAQHLLTEEQIRRAGDDSDRLSLRAAALDSVLSNTFRNAAQIRFEDRLRSLVHSGERLTTDVLAREWSACQRALYGPDLHLSDGYEDWWSYLPHTALWPGHSYAYVYAQVLALTLARTDPDAVVALLQGGGSAEPDVLASGAGLDLRDPTTFFAALDLMGQQVAELDELGRSLGGLPGGPDL